MTFSFYAERFVPFYPPRSAASGALLIVFASARKSQRIIPAMCVPP